LPVEAIDRASELACEAAPLLVVGSALEVIRWRASRSARCGRRGGDRQPRPDGARRAGDA